MVSFRNRNLVGLLLRMTESLIHMRAFSAHDRIHPHMPKGHASFLDMLSVFFCYIFLDPDGSRWIQVDPDGSRGIQVDPGGSERPLFPRKRTVHTLRASLPDTHVRLFLQSYTPQGVSNIMWALATMGYVHEPLMRAAASQTARQLMTLLAGSKSVAGVGRSSRSGSSSVCGSQEVANITWAFATLGFHPGESYLRQVGTIHCEGRGARVLTGW